MVDVPPEISPSEELARDMSSREAKRRAKRKTGSLFREFIPKRGKVEVSVDRMTHAGEDQARALAEARAADHGRRFFGWSVIRADRANRNGRAVVPSPTSEPDNPYHADIVLPTNDRDEQKEHAQELAAEAVWRSA